MVDATPTGSSCHNDSTLGTGSDLRVLLTNRGGTKLLTELPFTSGFFTRILDKTSVLEMTATVGGTLGETQCGDWDMVVPWATEIHVVRDGRDVWCGPTLDVQFDYGSVNIMAKDLSIWWDRRIIPRDMFYENMPACEVAKALHDAAMDADPIPNFFWDIRSGGELVTREYLYQQSEPTFDAIAELARTSIDWTVYNRTVIAAGGAIPTKPALNMTDDMWQTPPRVRAKGSAQATYVVVNAAENILGIAQAPPEYIEYYGRIDRIFDDADILDQEGAQRAADTRLAMLKDPYYIESPQGAPLKPSAPVRLENLIPGMVVRLNATSTAKRVTGDFRLQQVEVNFNGRVQLDMQPVGSFDEEGGF